MYEIYNPDAYSDGIPYESYAWLRENDPVSWCAEIELPTAPEGPGFWAVMRHHDVRYVSRESQIFSASLGATQLRDPDPGDLPFLRSMMLNMDPPEHNRYRRLLSQALTPKKLARYSDFIGHTTETLIANARELKQCDIVEQVTDNLALSTLSHVLGVPPTDRVFFYDWANRIVGYHDDEYRGESDDLSADPRGPAGLADMFEYADTLAEFRLRNPGNDLISALVHAEVEGRRLTPDEFHNTFFLLAVAGNDTTRGALPGVLLALMNHPDQFEALRVKPELLNGAVEEGLRFAPPVIHFRRTATMDTELCGAKIKAGQKVVVFYPSANRDQRAYEEPDKFDISRSGKPHATFGHGPHLCVAAGLARMQLRHFLTCISSQTPTLQAAGPVERLRSNFVAGIKRMPVSFVD